MRHRKYGNKPMVLDGHRFDSQMEARRYEQLKLLERAGEIRDLAIHPAYPITVGDRHICIYEADFAYVDTRGIVVVEDVKGAKTALYLLKKKLLKAVHGLDVQEVRA